MSEESVHQVAPSKNETTNGRRSYNSGKNIDEAKKRINKILKRLNNEVFVFDFGHYYYDEVLNNNEEEKHFLFKTVIRGGREYIETLFPKREDKHTDYRYFERSIKEVCNISEKENEIIPSEEDKFDTPIKEIVAKKPFKTDEWADTLAKKKIGGCLLVSSIEEGNHLSAVWVVLKKPIYGLANKVRCCMPCENCSMKEGCKLKFKNKAIDETFKEIDGLLSNELSYNLELSKNIEIYRQSTRAAISQVFVRNIANNLVPNVLKHVRNEESLEYSNFRKLIKNEKAYTSDIIIPLYNYRQQVANLFSYVADRCQYLNEATRHIAENEDSRYVYGQLFKELDANRLLLNHISGKKNFKYKINFFHNGVPLNENNDITVSLPAGPLGAQAFYNILENIIRNATKPIYQIIVEFTVNFIDTPLEYPFAGEDKYYRVEIWDNVPITKTEKELKEEIENIKRDDQYVSYFGLTEIKEASKATTGNEDVSVSWADNSGEERIKDAADLLVYKQNTQLNKSVIDPKNHTLRTSSLGLIEMEASAAFLRQEDLPEIESENYDLKDGAHYNYKKSINKYYPYFIQAIKHKLECNNGFSLGYRFYMKKPEEFEINDNKIM